MHEVRGREFALGPEKVTRSLHSVLAPLLLRFSAIRGGRALAVMRAYRLTRFGLLLGWWELSVARRRSEMTKLRFMTDLARGRLGGRLLLAVVSIF